jgi:predicted hydrocarbon binding protein
VNNHTKFAILLNDCVEEWGAELSDKHAVALFDKAEYTCSLFMENSSTGVENIAQLLYVEVKDILKVRGCSMHVQCMCFFNDRRDAHGFQ